MFPWHADKTHPARPAARVREHHSHVDLAPGCFFNFLRESLGAADGDRDWGGVPCHALVRVGRMDACRRIEATRGEWRSLVAHPAGGRAVAGSNPVSPIDKIPAYRRCW